MTEGFINVRLSRRRMLAGSVALAATTLSGATVMAQEATGGDIVFLIDSLGPTWIPNNSSISSFQGHIWGHVADKLLHVDSEGKLSPWIAERWEQNETATEFILSLKPGVTFSDGSPLDAESVVANLDIWHSGRRDDGINPVGLFPKTYDHAEAVDPLTVKVFFKAPTLGFIPTLGYHGSILISPKTLAAPASDQADLSKTVASGPYVVESWAESDYVKLVRRSDYNWGPAAVGRTGPATIDSITYKLVAEQSLRVAAVTAGQADVAYNAAPQELESLKAEGLVVATPRYLGFVNGWAINTKQAPYDDVRVRQALQAALNRQEIIDTVYTPDWKLPISFIQSNVPGVSDNSALLVHDPDRADALLDEAGWVKDAQGLRSKDGAPLTLTLHSNPYLATSQAVDELIAQQLSRVGWKVDIVAYDVATFGERVHYATEGVPAYEVTRSFIDPGIVAAILTDANNGENWFNVGESDSRLNELRDKIAGAGSLEERNPLLAELQAYVLEQGYFIPRTEIVQRIYVQSAAVGGVVYNGVAYASYYGATKSS